VTRREPLPEIARARNALRMLISLSMMSRRQVERRLVEQNCGTDLGRLLTGRLDLKVRHVVTICRVLGLHPMEYFRFVFREPEERSPFLRQVEALLGASKR